MNSNAAMRLRLPEPHLDVEGTWEIRPRSGEHVLSPRSRELLGIGDGEPVTIQRLLAALHPGDRERWKDAVAEVLDLEGSGACSIEFRTAGPVPRWLAASGRAVFDGMRTVRISGTLRKIGERCPLADICRQAIRELAHPGHSIDFDCWDEAVGEWDRDRTLALLRNLLSNTMEQGEPVIASLIDCSPDVLLSIARIGPRPPPDPLAAREIVRELGGRIERTSDESATAFHVWLPRRAS
jgi:ribosomal protein S14